jgi:two-component system, NarL family, nitrate/nitrite response regulator NarL
MTQLPESKNITVLIADDHGLVAAMVEMHLKARGGFDISRSDTLDQTLARVSESNVDVVLLDLDMPGMNGIAGVGRAVAANKSGYVVLFSGQARQEAVFSAIELGARGYIPKTLPLTSLDNALRFIAAGETYLPSSFAADLAKPKKTGAASLLSVNEQNVLKGICQGDSNKQIGRSLEMTEVTVKMHVRAICAKLHVSNRTQIAMAAVMRGLV